MKKVLISNLNFYKQGHHIFYQNILFEQVQIIENETLEFFFLFNNSEARDCLKNIHKNTVFLNEEECFELESSNNSFLKYFVRWRIVRKYVKILQIDEVFLMDFYEQSILPIVLTQFNFKVGGIVFRPFNRLKQIAVKEGNLKIWMSVYMKKVLMNLFSVKYKNISKLLILNDSETVDYLNSKYRYSFKFFPDPVNDYLFNSNEFKDIRSKYAISEKNKIFLVFGALSDVKNIENLVNAFLLLEDDYLEKCSILIMGKGISGYENYLDKLELLKNKLVERYHKFEFRIEYSFIDEIHHFNIFNQVDFVFLAYKNFYFSSATLGIAAKTRKPAIVPNYGPMANLTVDYYLGTIVNPDSVIDIKNSIIYCLEHQEEMNEKIKAKEFCDTFTKENFAKAILT